MSKEAALRAMREARYAQRTAATTTSAKASPAAPPPVAPPAASADELCGHRSVNGRSCTREKGHAAKSHRYS